MANYVSVTGTYVINGQDFLPNIARNVLLYDRASVPIQTIMMATKKVESTFNMTFQWYEGQYDDPNTTCSAITGVAANTPQTVTIASQNVRQGDTFYEPVSDQQFEVVLVRQYLAGSTQCDILKTPSTLSTSAVAGTPLFIRTGNIAVEGGPYPEATTNTPTRKSNGCSLVAGSIAVTDIMRDTPTYYNQGNELGWQKSAGIQQFRGNMERRIIWSKYFQESRTQTHNGATHSGTAYSGDGFVPRITTNVVTYAGTLTEATMDAALATVWGRRYYGGDMKLGFGGVDVHKDINGFAKDKIRTTPGGTNMWGLTITTYTAYAGQKLYLILEREFMNDNPQYKKALVVLDPAFMSLQYHGPALMMVKNTTPPGLMQQSIGLESRVGSKLEFEPAHMIVKQ